MKKIKYLFIICVILFVTSCDDFLDYKQSDKMIPKTIENFSELIYGEVINSSKVYMNEVQLMSDDAGEIVEQNTKSKADGILEYMHYYTWKRDIEVNYKGDLNECKPWAELYHKIVVCNVVIEEINNLPDSEKNLYEKYVLESECYFLRANAYFKLLNLFGEPFENAEQAKSALGIPLNNFPGIEDVVHNRSTVAEVYEQIEKDLNEAIKLFEEHPRKYNTIYRPNLDAMYQLLSRVYLYQKKYKQTVETCNKLLSFTGKTMYDLNKHDGKTIYCKENTGVVFTQENFTYLGVWSNSGKVHLGISQSLEKLFRVGDLRGEYYRMNSTSRFHPGKAIQGRTIKGKAFRIEEVYLNRAEACAYLGDYDKAVSDIESLRKAKYKEGFDCSVNYTTKEELIQIIRDERRVELCFEHHRWFDLRRYGCPEIRHNYPDINNTDRMSVYVLEKGSPNYTLAIPRHVKEINGKIKDIERVEIKAE